MIANLFRSFFVEIEVYILKTRRSLRLATNECVWPPWPATRGKTVGTPDNRHTRSFRRTRNPACTDLVAKRLTFFNCHRLLIRRLVVKSSSVSTQAAKPAPPTEFQLPMYSVRKLLIAIAFRYLSVWAGVQPIGNPPTEYELPSFSRSKVIYSIYLNEN